MKQKEKPLEKQLEQLLTTIYQVSRKIPGCEGLHSKYGEFWATSERKHVSRDDLMDIRKDLRHSVTVWLENTEEGDIVKVLKALPPSTRKALRQLVRRKYRGFFASDYEGFPNDFAAPTPFLLVGRKAGKRTALAQPIIRRYGSIVIKIQNTALHAEDGKTTFALLLLKNMKKIKTTPKNIFFQTTMLELCRTLQKNHPYAKDTQNAIWASLERLRGCTMTLTNAKGLRTLGGILDGAVELEEDSNLEIGIYLDRNFVELIEEGYVSLNPDIYFPLPPSEANLYAYLMRQKTFNTGQYLKPVHIAKVHDTAGFGGLKGKKPRARIRYELKQALKGLEAREIIKKFSIEDDLLSINCKRQKGKKKQESKTKVKQRENGRCLYGHKFGVDADQYNDCELCEEWAECEDANVNNK